MVWARGHRADYDGWAEAGNTGWDFNSVLPLFKKSEDWEGGGSALRGGGGPIRVERARDLHPAAAAFIDAGRSCGMSYLDDLNVPEPEGVGPMNLNIKGGRRCSPAEAFLWPVMGNRNLTVLTEAPAVKLTLNDMCCTGVEFLLDGELRSVGASREVILCAGAIHTPSLLLLSGVGPMLTSSRSASTPSSISQAWGETSRTTCGSWASASRRSTPCRPRITTLQAAPASGKAGLRSVGRT
jgi:choline dehydrogenase